MTLRLILIVAAVAVFAWGFSTLVEHAEPPLRTEGTGMACDEWSGENCTRLRQ